MQIGVEGIDNLLMWLWCWILFLFLKTTNPTNIFSFPFIWKLMKWISIWKLSKGQLMKLKIMPLKTSSNEPLSHQMWIIWLVYYYYIILKYNDSKGVP
jgi:hypothetical protein